MTNSISLQQEVYFMTQRFQEFVVTFHEIEKKNKEFEETNNAVKIALINHELLLKECLEKLNNNSKRLDDAIPNLSQKLDSWAKKQDALENQMNSFLLNLNAIRDSLESVNGRIVNSEKEIQKEKELLAAFSQDMKNANSSLSSHETKMSFLLSKYEEHENLIAQRLSSTSILDGKISDCASELKTLKDRFAESQRVSEDRFDRKLNDAMQAVNKSIEGVNSRFQDIKMPSTDDLVKIDELKKFANQIESLKLDANNAMLKASNCDIQLQVVHKKIENLQLLTKNFELTKGN